MLWRKIKQSKVVKSIRGWVLFFFFKWLRRPLGGSEFEAET